MTLEDEKSWDSQIICLLSIEPHFNEHELKIPKVVIHVTFITVNYGDTD